MKVDIFDIKKLIPDFNKKDFYYYIYIYKIIKKKI